MKRVTHIQTADGKLHDTVQQAQRYADVRYTDAVSQLAAELVRIDKYQDMKDYVDANLGRFTALRALKDDLTPPDDDEDS